MIRPYQKQDTNAIIDLWYRAVRQATPFLKAEFLESEKDNIRNIYLPNTETWIFEEQGKVVGFVALMGDEVGGLFVDPEFQGSGIGKKLLDQACKELRRVSLEVFARNVQARRFYSNYGFSTLYRKIHRETGEETFRLILKKNR